MLEQLKKTIQYVKGVGPKKAALLNRMNIFTIQDIMFNYPREYEKRKKLSTIDKIKINGKYLIKIKVISSIEQKNIRKGLNLYSFVGEDLTGRIYISFFNTPFLKKLLSPGTDIYVYGEVKIEYGKIKMTHPEYYFEHKEYKNEIMPIYNMTKGINQNDMIKCIYECMKQYKNDLIEYIPNSILQEKRLCGIKYAIENIHFPKSKEHLKIAKYRLVYEELLSLQLALYMVKNRAINKLGIKIHNDNRVKDFIDNLPFKLTNAQNKVMNEIIKDLGDEKPMNRLVQGDVGSGKTVIALISLYTAVLNGYQGALMAPTEILATQHFEGCSKMFEELGVKVRLITGSTKAKEKENVLRDLKQGSIDIIIGTHSLIQDKVKFHNLALVITDEQHRFGVNQRNVFSKKGLNPNILVMTATPIPRTLALIMYGDLDVSIIDELPPGRKEIKTFGKTNKDKHKVYEFVKEEIKKGRQAYIVAPLVEESDTLNLNSATEIYEDLRSTYFSDYNVGLLHGKMKNKDKDFIMNEFKNNNVQILISTTVIEVGVNVPNSSIMVIENSERFGLAQLHQLRGRVGRGEYQSYCILINGGKSEVSKKRVEIMTKTNDGFVIAEEDLKIRGPGEFFGTIQHGIPQLKIANLFKHMKILKDVQRDVEMIMSEDPFLDKEEFKSLKKEITNKFGSFIGNISL